eukprot:5012462-Amphidinium_carterae.1
MEAPAAAQDQTPPPAAAQAETDGSPGSSILLSTLTGVYVPVDVGGLDFPPTPFPPTPVAVLAQGSTVCPWERPRAAPQGVAWKTSLHRVMLYRSSMTLALREVTGQKSQIASAKVSGDLAAAYCAAMGVLLRYERGEVPRPELKQRCTHWWRWWCWPHQNAQK